MLQQSDRNVKAKLYSNFKQYNNINLDILQKNNLINKFNTSEKDLNNLKDIFDIEVLIETNTQLNKRVQDLSYENQTLEKEMENMKNYYLKKNINSYKVNELNYKELEDKLKYLEEELKFTTNEKNDYKRKTERLADKNITLIKTIDEINKKLYYKEKNSFSPNHSNIFTPSN